MRILHISDTHSKHNLLQNLPKADVIVHSGDASFSDSDNEVLDFLNWFCDLDFLHKIFVAGNHDDCLYGKQIEGVNFWGVPLFVGDYLKNNLTSQLIAKIPQNTDVLISHSPPFGILDFDDNINYGCPNLLKVVKQINPRFHLFGHIHANNGIQKIGQTTFVNSAIVNGMYEFVNKPKLLEI